MKNSLTIATAIAAAVMLAGCATPAAESASSAAPAAAPTTAAIAPSPSSTPVEVQAAAPAPTPTFGEADRLVLVMASAMDYYHLEVTPEQARTAADFACDQLAAGTPAEQITPLTGESVPAEASADLVAMVQSSSYCDFR